MVSNQSRSVTQVIRELVLRIYLPTLLNATARGALLVLLPLYALEGQHGEFIAAAIVGLRAAGTMVSDVPSGQLVAKFGDKSIMLVGLLVITISSFGAAFSNVPLLLGLVAFGIGVGTGAWILGRLSHITEKVPINQRGRVIAVLAGLERAGVTIGPIVAGVSVELVGYPLVFVGTAVLSVIAFGLIFIYTTRTQLRTSQQVQVGSLQILIRHRRTFYRAGGVMICLSYLRNARHLLIPVWGTAIGLGPAEIGFIFGLASLFDFLMAYPAGQILDHIGRKAALIPAMTLLSLSMLFLPLATSYYPLLAVATLAGLGNGFGTGIFMTLGGDFAPRYGRSHFLGIWRLIGDSGGAVGPFAIGGVSQFFSMGIACVSTGFVGLIGALVALFFIEETREPNPR